MAPRANWKGFLRLSLVTCPVALFPATSDSEKISFNQINRATGHRIAEIVKPGTKHAELPKGSEEQAVGRVDRFRHAAGGSPTAAIREESMIIPAQVPYVGSPPRMASARGSATPNARDSLSITLDSPPGTTTPSSDAISSGRRSGTTSA